MESLRGFVESWRIAPLRELVHRAGTPDELTSIVRRCEDIERDITAGLGTYSPPPPVSVDDQECPLLKLAIVHHRRTLADLIEEQTRRTFHPQLIKSLSSQLKPYEDLMKEFWLENSPMERMPQLTDFVTLQAALEVLGDRSTLLERQFDEKFHILQAPTLLQADLAYYRDHCELRGASLAVGYLDIDNFKKNFNSRYGETVVDRSVLPRFMMSIEALLFGRGHAYRYGGDEYAIVLPGLQQSAAIDALDELRLRVKELKYIGVDEITTVSIGLFGSRAGLFLDQRRD